jgi:hypothetical protein
MNNLSKQWFKADAMEMSAVVSYCVTDRCQRQTQRALL